MKYKNHDLIKVYESDVDGGFYYEIRKNDKFITTAWTLSNAKEFVDSFDGVNYRWNVLC